jgi:hypothetical protein
VKKKYWEGKKTVAEALRAIYPIPAPEKKETFFQSARWQDAAEAALYSPRISWMQFLRIQVHYIRKWNWILSAAVFAAALFLTLLPAQITGVQDQHQSFTASAFLSACIPFLALATVTEAGYSARCGMEELELSTRFSLHAVLCARLGILGTENLLLLGILLPFGVCLWEADLGMAAACILLPYLLTCALTLPALRKFRGKECTILCAGISVLVSTLFLILNTTEILHQTASIPAAIPASLILVTAAAAAELRKYIRQSEELTWNFTLTA